MNAFLRFVLVAAISVLSACTKPNQLFCCVTDEQCAAAGVDEIRPCAAGQACAPNNSCVAKECDTSADCTSPEAPSCANGLCIQGCAIDDDCAGVPGAPRCDPADNACAGCVSSDQCPAEAAICDPETRSCRGCVSDDDCDSGVCIEADARCAAENELIYVAETGAVDSGACTADAPCRTLLYAQSQIVATRRVVRILGGTYSSGSATSTVMLHSDVILDGTNTLLTIPAVPMLGISGPATAEGIRINGGGIRVDTAGALKLFDVTLEELAVDVRTGGSVSLDVSELEQVDIRCTAGAVRVTRSRLDRSAILTDRCAVEATRTRFGPGPVNSAGESVVAVQGLVRIENNIFAEPSNAVTPVRLSLHSTGSTFRFNTIVTTSEIQTNASAMQCDDSVAVTSNIFAHRSMFPLAGSCVANFSLFDEEGASAAMTGVGNASADASSFFIDRANDDLRLPPNSPALRLGEPGLLDEDFDGAPRPVPAGTNPDVGAYEAP